MLTSKQSNMLFTAKALAVLLVVWAHMYIGTPAVLENIRVSVCQMGVPVFFVCAGFFYKRQKNDLAQFWKKKGKTILFPWVLFATATFVLSVLLSGSAAGFPLSYIKWVFGVGTVYWYMSVMLLCFVVFRWYVCSADASRKTWYLYGCIAFSLLMVIISMCSVIDYNLNFNQYTNAFNWFGWFALGILIREKQWLDRISSWKAGVIALPLLIVFCVLSVCREPGMEAYIDIYSLPIEILGTVCILAMSRLLCNGKLLVDVGKKSFFIYLVHIQIAGVTNTRLPSHWLFFLVKPIAAVAICYVVAKVCEWILKKINLYDKLGSFLALR